MTATTNIWLRLRWLLWLWTVVLTTVLSSSATVDYDGQSQATVAYDAAAESSVGYDVAPTLSADGRKQAMTGHGALLLRFPEFLAAKTTGQGFNSFSSFKRTLGPAGENAQWHHIVEQTPGNLNRFGAQTIHNTDNLVRVPTDIHRQISGFYSSKQPFTGGQTVRQWLGTQPIEAQQQFGRQVMQQFGAPLP